MTHVLFVVDEAYARHLPVAMNSLLMHAKSPVTFHIVHSTIARRTREAIAAYVDGRATCLWYAQEQNALLRLDAYLPHVSSASFLRLVADTALPPDVKRIVYLDVDVLVLDDIAKIASMDLQGCSVAVVADPGVDAREFARTYGLEGPGLYFNAGVIVMDIEAIRVRGSLARAREAAEGGRFSYGDQDILNICFWGDAVALASRWNVQRNAFYREGTPEAPPAILHFTDDLKPWRSTEWHPRAYDYLVYLAHTPFADEIRREGGLTRTVALRWRLRKARHELRCMRAHLRRRSSEPARSPDDRSAHERPTGHDLSPGARHGNTADR